MELTQSEKILLSMLLNQHYQFLAFGYKGSLDTKEEAEKLVFSIDSDCSNITIEKESEKEVVKVKEEHREKLPAVTHVDGSARVQTVYKHTVIHDLLTEFEKFSGYPILLNTSFNVKDKTMVLTPKDAVETFFDTEMDILVMGNFVMYKN